MDEKKSVYSGGWGIYLLFLYSGCLKVNKVENVWTEEN